MPSSYLPVLMKAFVPATFRCQGYHLVTGHRPKYARGGGTSAQFRRKMYLRKSLTVRSDIKYI